jgi:hypothetical protein
MAPPSLTEIDVSAVAAVRLADRRRQSVCLFRHGNQVNVVAHEAVGPNRYTVMRAPRGHEIDIDPKVIVPEKGVLPPVAPLGDVVR